MQSKDEDDDWMYDVEDLSISPVRYEITSSPNDFNVMTLVNFMEKGVITIPPYQRNFTWGKPRASKLIESLIVGLPVPQVFFYEEARNQFAILDGHQRLMSILFFRKGRFPKKDRSSALREIYSEKNLFPSEIWSDDQYFDPFLLNLKSTDGEARSPLHDQSYESLADDGLQTELDLRAIRCVIVKQNEPKNDNSSVYEIFSRLNTSGVNLKPQEIRASLYFSPFYELIYKLNKEPTWRQLLQVAEPDTNLRDIELIVRAFSMLVMGPSYQPSMTRFLNNFSHHAKTNKLIQHEKLFRDMFSKFVEDAVQIGSKKFEISGKFSIALFESAYFASCRNCWESQSISDYRPPTLQLMEDLYSSVRRFLQEGTTKKEYVLNRLNSAKGIWDGFYSNN